MKNLYSQPFRNWSVAVRSFKEHANTKSGMDSDSKIPYNSFLDQYKGREVPVNKMVHSYYKTNVKKPRETIAPIFDTVKLKNQPELRESGLTNTGNLIELLNYWIRGG